MDDKMLNLSEAFIKMTESFLKVIKAVTDAKSSIDHMLRLQYKEAGSPFGESEEGLLLWLDKMSKDYAMLCSNTSPAEFHGISSGADREGILYIPEQFSSLKGEIKSRIN